MTEPGDRVPIPPGEQPAEQPQGVRPVATPIQWSIQRVAMMPETGEPVVMVKFWLVTGEVVLFIPSSAATRIADQLYGQASGIVLPGHPG